MSTAALASEQTRQACALVETALGLARSTKYGHAYRMAIDELMRIADEHEPRMRRVILEFSGAMCLAADEAGIPCPPEPEGDEP